MSKNKQHDRNRKVSQLTGMRSGKKVRREHPDAEAMRLFQKARKRFAKDPNPPIPVDNFSGTGFLGKPTFLEAYNANPEKVRQLVS